MFGVLFIFLFSFFILFLFSAFVLFALLVYYIVHDDYEYLYIYMIRMRAYCTRIIHVNGSVIIAYDFLIYLYR